MASTQRYKYPKFSNTPVLSSFRSFTVCHFYVFIVGYICMITFKRSISVLTFACCFGKPQVLLSGIISLGFFPSWYFWCITFLLSPSSSASRFSSCFAPEHLFPALFPLSALPFLLGDSNIPSHCQAGGNDAWMHRGHIWELMDAHRGAGWGWITGSAQAGMSNWHFQRKEWPHNKRDSKRQV